MDELTIEQTPQEKPQNPNEPVCVVGIMFRSGGKIYYFDPGALEIPAGSHVIIDTARGLEFGTCITPNHNVRAAEVVLPLRPVVRIATPSDEHLAAEYREKEKAAFDICNQKIAEQGLEMQLVSVEYAFDGSKILFFFTADGRVDFRELVKSLAAVFRTRIELRQIGVRDKAKMVGGLGICGRPFCCSEFLEDFQPVSIKMAKVQNLSLNPTKISGTCGRLMCCLKYEQEAYEDLLRQSPRNESFVDTPDGRGTITEVNLLRQSVKVRMEDHPEEINTYRNDTIAVLRSGKGHKNDPPIPREIAPISGGKEQPPKPRLRTSAPAAKEQPAAEAPEPRKREAPDQRKRKEETPDAAHPQRRPRPPRPEGEKSAKQPRPEGEKPAKQPRPEGEKPAKQPRPEGGKPPKQPRPEGGRPPKQPRPEGGKSTKPPRPEGEKPVKQPRPEGEKQPRAEGEKPAKPRPEGRKPQNNNRRYYHRKPNSGGES